MFDFIVRRRHMYYECDTKQELEDFYLERQRESNDDSVGAKTAEEFASYNTKDFRRDRKILLARLRTNWKPKDRRRKPPKEVKIEEKHEITEPEPPIQCPCEIIDKKEIQTTEE